MKKIRTVVIISVEVNICLYFIALSWLDNEIDRKIDVTTILFLLVQNRHQTHDWTLIGLGANGLGIQKLKINS